MSDTSSLDSSKKKRPIETSKVTSRHTICLTTKLRKQFPVEEGDIIGFYASDKRDELIIRKYGP